MNRRELVIGSMSLVFAASIPNIVSARSFDNDMADVIQRSLIRYKTEVEEIFDWMEIFTEELKLKMKQWGTLKPLEQCYMASHNGIKQPINLWTDPNIFDNYNIAGMTWGFGLSFKDPENHTIKVWYDADKNEFEFTRV